MLRVGYSDEETEKDTLINNAKGYANIYRITPFLIQNAHFMGVNE